MAPSSANAASASVGGRRRVGASTVLRRPVRKRRRSGIMMGFPGPLAQLVEQRTLNPLVVGSNPTRPTTPFKHLASAPAGAICFVPLPGRCALSAGMAA